MMDLHEATEQARRAGWREGMQEALGVADFTLLECKKALRASTKDPAAKRFAQGKVNAAAQIAETLVERIGGAG
jgi:hypothetical protein